LRFFFFFVNIYINCILTGISPGLYLLIRSPDETKFEWMKSHTHSHFLWQRPPDCPPSLPLYFLQRGDATSVARVGSCIQDIAKDGAFSLGMIVEMDAALQRDGPSAYRKLFWECGMIGQMLYLEAEAEGIRGTGIGCFFDNFVHKTFGLTDGVLQSFYHFTVGGPVEDKRLQTSDPYVTPKWRTLCNADWNLDKESTGIH
jgi:hypothetical protein